MDREDSPRGIAEPIEEQGVGESSTLSRLTGLSMPIGETAAVVVRIGATHRWQFEDPQLHCIPFNASSSASLRGQAGRDQQR
jgi:hypothetical protein